MTRARILADYVAGGTTAAEFDYLDGLTSTAVGINDTQTLANKTLATTTTFPAGHIIQVKTIPLGDQAQTSSDFSLPSSAAGFDNAIQSDSDVLVTVDGQYIQRASGGHVNIYIVGGGFGSGSSSSAKIAENHGSYGGGTHMRATCSGTHIDTAPGSTTPTYQVFYDIASGEYQITASESTSTITLLEIKR